MQSRSSSSSGSSSGSSGSSGNTSPLQKLKDSCDLCSASKVRCDKQKPVCARCASLNHPCLYSPAKRAGRPHGVRREKREQQCNAIPVMNGGRPFESMGVVDTGNELGVEDIALFGPQTIALQQQQQCYQHDQQLQSAEALGFDVPKPCKELGCCTGTATSILEQLDIARRNPGKTEAITVTDACRRLSTVLICPCSEQLNVALLVAAGCIALMDMVQDVPNSHHAQDTTSQATITATTSSTTVMPGLEGDMFTWSMQSSSLGSLPASCPSFSMVNHSQRNVGELAKIAKVVLQFTDRYRQEQECGAGWAYITWVLAPSVALLRSRLQSVTSDATRRLVF